MEWKDMFNNLIYIIIYGREYVPDYNEPLIYEEEGGNQKFLGYDTNLHMTFLRRYEETLEKDDNDNDKNSTLKERFPFKKEDYDNNSTIQELISQLQLQAAPLWYFTLFAYDYSYFLSKVGEVYHCAEFELKDFAEQILNSATGIEDIEQNEEAIKFDEPTNIILQTGKSKKKATLCKSYSIIKLAHLIQEYLEAEGRKTERLLHNFEGIRTDEPMTIRAFRFANIFIEFFKTQEQVTNQRRQGASTSEIEKRLISNLFLLTTIVKKEDISLDNSYLKSILNRHKDLANNTPDIYYA